MREKMSQRMLLSVWTEDKQGGSGINLVKALGLDTKKNFLAADCYKEMWYGEDGLMQFCPLRAIKIV